MTEGRARAAWMFDDLPRDSLAGAGQRLGLAWTRLIVVALYRPLVRPLFRLFARMTSDA